MLLPAGVPPRDLAMATCTKIAEKRYTVKPHQNDQVYESLGKKNLPKSLLDAELDGVVVCNGIMEILPTTDFSVIPMIHCTCQSLSRSRYK